LADSVRFVACKQNEISPVSSEWYDDQTHKILLSVLFFIGSEYQIAVVLPCPVAAAVPSICDVGDHLSIVTELFLL